jgi:curved DNA-binding protein CbpA
MKNRRNYYRILQVQPDAPIEIIRTSYHALMRDLKKHPDLGGDHWTATVINEAYETLSDSVKRAEYDRALFAHYTKSILPQRNSNKVSAMSILCPMCNKSLTHRLSNDKSCPHCSQFKAKKQAKAAYDSYHRSVKRIKKEGELLYHFERPQKGREAHMLDLSPKGIRFTCHDKLQRQSTINIGSPLFNAVARVVICEENTLTEKTTYSVGAQFLSVTFKSQKGSFYSGSI